MKKLTDKIELIKTTGYIYYLKWFSTFIIVIAVSCRSAPEVDRIYDLIFSLIGTIGWLIVSINWKDRALIILNSVLTFILFTGLLKYLA